MGNKCDEEDKREVSTEYARDLVSKDLKNCGFMETSAKTNHNVKEAFQVDILIKVGNKRGHRDLFFSNCTVLALQRGRKKERERERESERDKEIRGLVFAILKLNLKFD